MIKRIGQTFALETKQTGYYFHVTESGHLEHIYYGKNVRFTKETDGIFEKCECLSGNLIAYSNEFPKVGLEDMCLELSSYGKGDIREPFVTITHKDGSWTSDFLFEHAEIIEGKAELIGLPSSYDESGQVMSLCVRLLDKQYQIALELTYSVFEDCDVITRSAKVINLGEDEIRVNRLLSTMVDFEDSNYELMTFHGAWAREMDSSMRALVPGKFVNSSMTGTTSSRNNPFIVLKRAKTTEDHGDCFGFNLIYSGNHYEVAEVNAFGKTRIACGVNPEGFSYVLGKDEAFQAPEAVMTFSSVGLNQMSHQMHEFVREHIVRGEWKKKERPVLLNSWEAAYFKFDERKLLSMAKDAADAGIELFVLDDGWFGKRDDDTSSLGDWYVNEKKLPNGLSGLADKIEKLGMKFGLWVEPEMVNENSDLYRAHPEYAVRIPGMPHSIGRNQMILDLTQVEVQEHIIESISKVLASAKISYVKWDMNRIFSDYYSSGLSPLKQEEFSYRYVVGLYHVMKTLTERFPHILFEGCSAGGNRFDLGILCYFPQIWASDDTDAIERSRIQTGYSYGYPMSVVSAHVSGCPNHQTLRKTSIQTRFHVACFGVLGYECNLGELKKEEYEEVKRQIAFYKEHRQTLQFGNYYRIEPDCGVTSRQGLHKWMCVAKDRSEAYYLSLQELMHPNQPYDICLTKGLEEHKNYHFYLEKRTYNVKEFGDLINTVAPIHVKQDSLVHNIIAKVVKMDGETEDYIVTGSILNNIGIRLKQGFQGVGYNENVRFAADFASRLYRIEEVSNAEEE